jgi:hypothetical protein
MRPRSCVLAAALSSLSRASSAYLRRLDVCALPPSRLFLSAIGGASCDDGGALTAACAAACSCRRFGLLDGQETALCLGDSAGECPAIDCRVVTMPRRLDVGHSADTAPQELATSDTHSGPPVWVWVVVGVGGVLLLAAAVFLINWFRHRPRKGDNRTEVAEAERAVQWRKDARAAARRESAATTHTTRTRETNASAISGASGESYHGLVAGAALSSPARRYGSPLVGTELAVSMFPSERVFSPISDESKDSSEYSQGVDDPGSVLRAPLVQPRDRVDESESSDMDSLSSGLTIEEESKRSEAPYPRKKSIEF